MRVITNVCVAAVFLAMAAPSGSPQNRPAPQATFRSGIDLIELDVSVLDRARQPVRGLAAQDFTVLVDGQPRPIYSFRAVDLPPPVRYAAAWLREVAPDVATNTRPTGRVVVIMIDDGVFAQVDEAIDIRAVQKTRAIARAAVDELGPNDLAAVVYTENNHAAQNFTTDRTRLLAAIEKSAIFPGSVSSLSVNDARSANVIALANDVYGSNRGSCACGLCSIDALRHVSQSLQSIPHQRKILIYVSVGIVVEPDKGKGPEMGDTAQNWKLHCNLARRDAMAAAFRQAQIANVTIQAVDPKGLVVGQVGGDPTTNPTSLRTEFLKTVAETTGGRAVVNDNEMERFVPALLAESSAYYMLAVESGATGDDGRFHPIEVRVNRPDVEVRTRKGYYTPTAKERKAMAAGATRSLNGSIDAALPKSDFPLDASVAPIAGSNRKTEVAVTLAVTQAPRATPGGAAAEPLDVLVRAFNPETGEAVGSASQRLTFSWNATGGSPGQLEVLSRLPLRPGRYELRAGVKAADDRTASVYAYVDVPDFARQPLALSGLVVSAIPAAKAAPKGAFADLMPVVPTARRTFRPSDRLTLFLRVYQGGSGALRSAVIRTRVVDSTDAEVGSGVELVSANQFGASRSFDYKVDLPVRDLPAGIYLLTLDVASDDHGAQRAVRFRVVEP
jgi:VWFA-related protein